MAKAGTLTVKIVGDASNFERTMGKVQSGASKFGSSVAKYGKIAAVGVGAAATGAAMLGQEVLNTGAKLTTWRLKTQTVFEGSAKDIRKWADANNEAFGLTDDELAGLAASFGDLLKPMGFTAKEAASMSKDVVGLSGALSEWTGGQRSAAEVSDILAKAMLGERESLKELGISIMEADVQQRLLEKGQQDLTGAALQQAKAIATQELIFEKSVDAQKAYAAGGNEALRAQNNLKAGVAELREQLADRLLPIVTQVTQWMADNLPAALDKAGQIAGALRDTWNEVFPQIKTITETVINAVRTVIEVFTTVVTALWSRFGETIVRFVTESWNNIRQIIEGALSVIRGVFDVFAGLFTGDWGRMWDGIKAIVTGAWQVITGAVQQALNQVRTIISGAMVVIGEVWRGAWQAVTAYLSEAWANIRNGISTGIELAVAVMRRMPGLILNALGDLGSVLYNKGRELVEGFIRGIQSMASRAASAVANAIPGGGVIRNAIGAIPGFHTGGTFAAPRAGGAGIALLRDGERVSTPTEPQALGVGRDPERDGVLMARAFSAEMRRLQRAG